MKGRVLQCSRHHFKELAMTTTAFSTTTLIGQQPPSSRHDPPPANREVPKSSGGDYNFLAPGVQTMLLHTYLSDFSVSIAFMCTGKPESLIYFVAELALLWWSGTEPTVGPRCSCKGTSPVLGGSCVLRQNVGVVLPNFSSMIL